MSVIEKTFTNGVFSVFDYSVEGKAEDGKKVIIFYELLNCKLLKFL